MLNTMHSLNTRKETLRAAMINRLTVHLGLDGEVMTCWDGHVGTGWQAESVQHRVVGESLNTVHHSRTVLRFCRKSDFT